MNKLYYGKTRFETILVMLLLIMLGISTYTLVVAMTTSYEKIQNEVIVQDNLRLASSYIDSKIKQSDKKNISVQNDVLGSKWAIVLEEEINKEIYQTIIYFKDLKLREIFTKKGTSLDESSGFEIASIDNFEIKEIGKNLLEINFYAEANNQKYEMQTIINLN